MRTSLIPMELVMPVVSAAVAADRNARVRPAGMMKKREKMNGVILMPGVWEI